MLRDFCVTVVIHWNMVIMMAAIGVAGAEFMSSFITTPIDVKVDTPIVMNRSTHISMNVSTTTEM